MSLCMIKTCENKADEEGLCAQHYTEIIKKVVPEMNADKKKDGSKGKQNHGKREKEEKEVYAKVQYFFH